MTQPQGAGDDSDEAGTPSASGGSSGAPGSVDPLTGELPAETDEMPAEAAGAEEPADDAVLLDDVVADGGADDELILAATALAERTLDLQRLQAEFLNYKRRVERDRDLIRENATYSVLAPITEVLDTIDRAREHEPLQGGFKSVAEQLERIVSGLGLSKFAQAGDAFDPTLHEAISHLGTDDDVEVTTAKVVVKAGYRIGDRVVRAAQVLVVDPAS